MPKIKTGPLAIFKLRSSRLSLLFAVFYCSFLTYNFFPSTELDLGNQIESSSFFVGDDLEDSPARHLEVGNHQNRTHHSVRGHFDYWTFKRALTILTLHQVKVHQVKYTSSRATDSATDYTILYSIFRI